MKSKISTNDYSFRVHKSYTPEEILAAGGATAFGRRKEKANEELIKKIQNAPPIEPFTDEEWDSLMKEMENDK